MSVSPTGPKLEDGSRVAVMGGGPAGSFFSYFLLQMAHRVGLDIQVEIYEPKDFDCSGPKGCNMCGGIISESLVQNLAAEGINIPSTVVQRGIDSYFLHMDVGDVRIETPLQEKRIAAVHRGAGPRGSVAVPDRSFDGYLQHLAVQEGAQVVHRRVEKIDWCEGRPQVHVSNGLPGVYDLLAVTVGVNSASLKLFEEMGLPYRPPRSTKTYICEYYLGREVIQKYLGSSMHVFLLDLPDLEFAALIPKGDYVTFCLLGRDISRSLVESFLNSPEVRSCLPPQWEEPKDFCHCSPRINTHSAVQPFADRLVFIGDCGATRLYKDGIGAAYRTAKAAARTAVFEGLATKDFLRGYWPACKAICSDNLIGRLVFAITHQIQHFRFLRRGLWRMVSREQRISGARRMSTVLWDTFTGSAPYREVFWRATHPLFLGRFLWEITRGIWPAGQPEPVERRPQ
jgi:flavin-dependent dehydrogenase